MEEKELEGTDYIVYIFTAFICGTNEEILILIRVSNSTHTYKQTKDHFFINKKNVLEQ